MNHLAPRNFEPPATTLIDTLCHHCFSDGYIEVAKALPFNARYSTDETDVWFYELGRTVANEARSTYGRVPHLWCDTDAGSVINPQIISLAGAMFMTGAFA